MKGGIFTLFAAFLSLAFSTAAGVSVTWDNATPGVNQTITGTEILLDGAVIGLTDQETLTIDDSGWLPGDYSFTARHVGTVDGIPATSAETAPLIYTIAQAGVPGVAPQLRFHQLDRTA